MPYELELLPRWRSQGWKVKVYDREGPEEPHASILRGPKCWRVSLRSFDFLDGKPPAREVPKALLDTVSAQAETLRERWNSMHPTNPVSTREDDDV